MAERRRDAYSMGEQMRLQDRHAAHAESFEEKLDEHGSVLKAVAAVREADCRVAKVVTIVDRLEGAAENLAAEGLALAALFTRKDFIEPA